jgi:hypothetical protein
MSDLAFLVVLAVLAAIAVAILVFIIIRRLYIGRLFNIVDIDYDSSMFNCLDRAVLNYNILINAEFLEDHMRETKYSVDEIVNIYSKLSVDGFTPTILRKSIYNNGVEIFVPSVKILTNSDLVDQIMYVLNSFETYDAVCEVIFSPGVRFSFDKSSV